MRDTRFNDIPWKTIASQWNKRGIKMMQCGLIRDQWETHHGDRTRSFFSSKSYARVQQLTCESLCFNFCGFKVKYLEVLLVCQILLSLKHTRWLRYGEQMLEYLPALLLCVCVWWGLYLNPPAVNEARNGMLHLVEQCCAPLTFSCPPFCNPECICQTLNVTHLHHKDQESHEDIGEV